MNDSAKILSLESRIKELEQELDTTKQHLKKYTAPNARRVYYERHKEEECKRAKDYKERTGYKYKPTKEQTKTYNKTAREKLKKKKELEKIKELEENN